MMKFTVGMYVINLGYLAVVREIKVDGSLLIENPRYGKWVADPEKCRVYNA